MFYLELANELFSSNKTTALNGVCMHVHCAHLVAFENSLSFWIGWHCVVVCCFVDRFSVAWITVLLGTFLNSHSSLMPCQWRLRINVHVCVFIRSSCWNSLVTFQQVKVLKWTRMTISIAATTASTASKITHPNKELQNFCINDNRIPTYSGKYQRIKNVKLKIRQEIY